MPTPSRRAVLLALFAFLGSSATLAQNNSPPPPAPDAAPQVDLTKYPPPVVLGLRVEAVRRRIPVLDRVVIVPSREAFVDALSRWTVDARFPILLDDGTPDARENIARFVRAFKPTLVLRWEGENTIWAQSIEAQRQLMSDAVAKAWGADNLESLPSRWGELRFIPPGVVLLSESDPLCLGGLALAAGRGQIPLWFTRDDADSLPAEFGGEMTEAQAASLRATLERELDRLGLPWNTQGDAIEAITVALELPGRISSSAGQRERTNPIVALSDYLGRDANGQRYAWTGLLVGDEQQGVFSAMSSLFLRPESAWLFNGYKPDGAFNAFEITPTRQLLADAGIEPTLDEAPFSGTQHWRRRAMRGVDAGLVHVNSSGLRRNFTLNPGVATGADIPVLNKPAIVHFVHSFSAEDVSDKRSIARRFLDNGAYVYVGSVDEPFLQAFQTPTQFLQRALSLAPVAAAARHDSAPVWKINVYGDPLTTLGAAPNRITEGAPDLPGSTNLDIAMRAALRDRDFATAARNLLLLGRDADLVRLYNAARANEDTTISPEFAEAAFSALFRVGDRDAMLHAAALIPSRAMHNSPMQDMLWQAMEPALDMSTPSPTLASILRDNVRQWNLLEDTEVAARATSSAEGKDLARAFVERTINDVKNDRLKARLTEILTRY